MRQAPKAFRLHIGLFGRRNTGKSSLLNALTRQQVSIVSDVAGTTTDPVEKPMEMLPIGPVLFIDTAGVDDVGALGAMRVQKTRQIFDRTDVGILVVAAGEWGPFEESILGELRSRSVPVIVVFNKSDLGRPDPAITAKLETGRTPYVPTNAARGEGVLELREALIASAPDEFINTPPIVTDLVPPGEMAILVVPIDMEAPKGRLIQPQVQTIRDLLDGDAYCMVVKERELRDALERLRRPPALVITDSQAFLKVAGDTPPGVKMTSFSILFARQKGDLSQFVEGALAIETLRPGDRVLLAEACAHHPIGDDIGRVKIPRWLKQYVGGDLAMDTIQGHEFPENLAQYKLLVHCGACMWNRREMLTRMLRCRQIGLPVANYGMTIAYTLGIFDRALEPFPDALEAYQQKRRRGDS
jgi:[FeFe] hydrogenase H-cluster maturation GTPase HydF